ncbi:MAG: alpha/beta hydrolase [Acidimicrobiales bacterium]
MSPSLPGITPFLTPGLPEGRSIDLPGRGSTWIREASGPTGAPTLLLLHGWTANSALNWFGTYDALRTNFNVVAMDHRGHGYGIRSRHRFQLEDCADDAAALLDELNIERAIAVGYSMGGPIAQLLWQRHPQLIDGLVLCATAARFREPRGGRVLDGVVAGLSFASRVVPKSVNRRVSERVLVSKYDTTPLGNWAREQARLNDLRIMLEAGHHVASYDAMSWIGCVDVPTAVVLTTRDETVLPHRQRQMANAISTAQIFEVNGRHDICATRPERFADVLVTACADVVARCN